MPRPTSRFLKGLPALPILALVTLAACQVGSGMGNLTTISETGTVTQPSVSTSAAPSETPTGAPSGMPSGTPPSGFPSGGPGSIPGGGPSASAGPLVTSGATTYNPESIQVAGCTASGVSQVICLADALKARLNSTQLASLQRNYSLSEAKLWSNLPQGLSRNRVGLNFGEMTTEQIQIAKALLVAVAGTTQNEGWDEIQQILNADEYLQANGGGTTYGAQNYYLALLGTPSATGNFEVQFGGHHLALANTYNNGALAGSTPSFRAVEPFGQFTWNNTTNNPMQQEKDTFATMLGSLSATEQTTAKLSATFGDILVGPQKDNTFPATPSGIKVSTLTAAQKTLVLNAIKTYIDDIAENQAFLSKYTSELDNTYVAFSGNTTLDNRNDYVRIDGPSVWIEYSTQGGIILSGVHPHSVWRDKTTDYGGNS